MRKKATITVTVLIEDDGKLICPEDAIKIQVTSKDSSVKIIKVKETLEDFVVLTKQVLNMETIEIFFPDDWSSNEILEWFDLSNYSFWTCKKGIYNVLVSCQSNK